MVSTDTESGFRFCMAHRSNALWRYCPHRDISRRRNNDPQAAGAAAKERCRCLAASFKSLPHFQEMPTPTTSKTQPAMSTPALPAISSVNATKLKPIPIKHRAQTARQCAGGRRFVCSHYLLPAGNPARQQHGKRDGAKPNDECREHQQRRLDNTLGGIRVGVGEREQRSVV